MASSPQALFPKKEAPLEPRSGGNAIEQASAMDRTRIVAVSMNDETGFGPLPTIGSLEREEGDEEVIQLWSWRSPIPPLTSREERDRDRERTLVFRPGGKYRARAF